jgi:hypothetical protein
MSPWTGAASEPGAQRSPRGQEQPLASTPDSQPAPIVSGSPSHVQGLAGLSSDPCRAAQSSRTWGCPSRLRKKH